MKSFRFLFLLLAFLFAVNNAFAVSNPAAVYCNQLGYKYNITKTSQGESGQCIFPDNSKCDEWDFLKGKCGNQYSYCALNGYNIKTVKEENNGYSSEYAVCVPTSAGKSEFNVTDILKISSDIIIHSTAKSSQNTQTSSVQSLPDSFDWRNYNGNNYITNISDQGSCGSCWAFSTVAALEGEANIFYNNPNLNLDLSEQDLVSCGVPIGFYPEGGGGCEGADPEDAMKYILKKGIANEYCFSYKAADIPCGNKSSDCKNDAWKINSYTSVPLTTNDIKNALVSKGPIVAGMIVYSDFLSYTGGIYSHNSSFPLGAHAVTIVGYGSYNGKNYWIVKNSWGPSWGENGYFRILMNDSHIDSLDAFVLDSPSPLICKGNVKLSLSPQYSIAGTTITATTSGLNNCYVRNASVIRTDLSTPQSACNCTLTGSGCSCTFTSPSGLSSLIYTSYVDKDSDGSYSSDGESYSTYLYVSRGGGGGGCNHCYMIAIGPYLLNIDPTPLISTISAILVIIEIVVLMTIYNRLKRPKKRKR